MLQRIRNIEDRLLGIFDSIEINGKQCFILQTGEVICITGINLFGALVIEYAYNIELAKKGLFG